MFNRPPRIQRELQPIPLELIPPPPLSTKPKINWLTWGLPIFAVGLMVALMFLLSSSTGGLSYLMFLPFILASTLASAITYRQQRKEYAAELKAHRDYFEREIRDKGEAVRKNKTDQLKLLGLNDPGTSDCLDLARERAMRLGERRPVDSDFLSFRIGTGQLHSKIDLKRVPIEGRDPQYGTLYDDADKLAQEAKLLDGAPILCDLKKVGTVGIAGTIDALQMFGWSSTMHLLTHHWPAEVNIVAFCSYVEVQNWSWLNKIKHKTAIFPEPVLELRDNKSVRDALLLLEEELRRRKALASNLRSIDSADMPTAMLPALLVIFDRVSGIYEHAAFSLLLKEGRALGVYGLFLMAQVDDLPAECGAIIALEDGQLSFKTTGPEPNPVTGVKPDDITREMIDEFSEKLSVIPWLIPEEVTEPPNRVPLLGLFPYSRLDDLPIETWWTKKNPFGYLRAPIGKFSPTADLIFDLNDSDTAHGPHGIIGGMTGSGKSELLKTIILSLALTHHPFDLNFALIDYKGGGAFDEFTDLPHVVGVVTDIQSHADYATRVIQSLYAEVKNRERILIQATDQFQLSKPHVDVYRTALRARIPLPRLIIIFDEYAEFQERHPEESKRLINIARLGRSLGIHLILCTQNPTGKAVDQQVRDNSNFTICLKVKTPETSKSMVGIPDAVRLHRGEAYFHVDGPQKFRVAYTGSDYNSPSAASQTPVGAGSSVVRTYLQKNVSEAKAIVEEICIQAKLLGIPKPPSVWRNALPPTLSLFDLLQRTSDRLSWDGKKWGEDLFQPPNLSLALMDEPAHQQQRVLNVKDHLLIFGPSGSGKSMALMTLATGIALKYSPTEAWIYTIDLSGRSLLRQLQEPDDPDKPAHYEKISFLPHMPKIGSVIAGIDTERLNRLFKMLNYWLTERSAAFRSIDDFNTLPGNKKKFPRIYVLVDGMNQQFNTNNPWFRDQLETIMRGGPTYGIYVILTGNSPRDIPEALQADRPMILLQSTDRSSIVSIVKQVPDTYQKKIETGQELPPGRGLINTSPALELQFASPAHRPKESGMGTMLTTVTEMSHSWKGKRPPSVEVLPIYVFSDPLQTVPERGMFTVGKSQESLDTAHLSVVTDGPLFMITSLTSGLGKTAALHLWLSELTCSLTPTELQLILIDFHSQKMGAFSRLPHLVSIDSGKKLTTHVRRKEDLAVVTTWLSKQVSDRSGKLVDQYAQSPNSYDRQKAAQTFGTILIAIDDYESFASSMRLTELQALTGPVVDGEELGVRLVLAEDLPLLPIDDLTRRAKKHGCGLLLGGSEGLTAYNETPVPYGQKTSNLPPGRGYLVRRRRAELIQAAAYWQPNQDPAEELRRRLANI